ncbi:MAG: phage major capsid protein [Firmicutes bacterium]|nr:phage major capsid protein [Bacillota bacterium]
MITISTAESALKNIYLESVIHDINTKTNPLLTMAQKNTKTIAEKDAKAIIRYGGEDMVKAGREDGDLPMSTDARQAEIIVPIKNLFGTFHITDKALKAAQNNPGAFASLIGGEMTNLVSMAQSNLNRMIFGGGAGLDMNGIDSLFKQGTLYNLSKSDHADIMPFESVNGDSSQIISEDDIICFLDEMEEHAGGQATNLIMTHPVVRRALFEELKDNRTNIDTAELAGGFRGFTFNGIPMYADVRCEAGAVYALDSESFVMQQLCDWTWLEGEDGSILRPVSGRPVYSATLVKYADFICEKPFLQGKLSGFNQTSFR